MQPRAIATDQAPAAIGPYSQAMAVGNLVFVSGQLPLDAATGDFTAGDIAAQTARCLDNLVAVLAAAGTSLDGVVQTTVYLKQMADFSAMNAVYATRFADPAPARATVAVAALPRDALIEIAAVAVVPETNA
jgi:2-iminobutanoate/2-iminopropanoate deaminase